MMHILSCVVKCRQINFCQLNWKAVRCFGNITPPFADDLTSVDYEDFGLGDFRYYKESPDVKRARELKEKELMGEDDLSLSLETAVSLKSPVIFNSHLNDPYVNLALEQYIYSKSPIDDKTGNCVAQRLMFYTNSPCVVIGKNQNPWREVNLPLLNNLRLPLLRRNSGGGTVVHDMGNVNFSFMTSKSQFDRFQFAKIVVNAVNNNYDLKLKVNERGDIVTEQDNLKVSGSAYKVSRGKSYHHGTMLLNSRLDILSQLLHRDDSILGVVDAMSSVPSVPSKVTNIGMESQDFIDAVSKEFTNIYNNESTPSPIVTIDRDTELPLEVKEEVERLKNWNWKYGNTPKFTHTLYNKDYDVKVKFQVGKNAIVEEVEVEASQEFKESFQFLIQMVSDKQRNLQYSGSNIAGLVLNDELSDWIGESIDGTT